MKKIKNSNWYAWIDQQPIQPTKEGTLHVTGEVNSHPSQMAILIKKYPQGINPRILLLQVILKSGRPTKQPQHVNYAESLGKEISYQSIEIFYEDDKPIATITDIPIID